MAPQIVLRHTYSSVTKRRRPLLLAASKSSSSSTFSSSSATNERSKVRFGEVAGGTAAECAAVCCCCPCAIMNLLVLAVYKLPAGLCRKALQQKRRSRLMKMGLLPQRSHHRHYQCGCDIHPVTTATDTADEVVPSEEMDKDVMKLEKEMWDRFYGAGFWRSASQKSNH